MVIIQGLYLMTVNTFHTSLMYFPPSCQKTVLSGRFIYESSS
ncbi:hypothetical protein Hanom_Chr13g01195121 [Helianthus anomalus]